MDQAEFFKMRDQLYQSVDTLKVLADLSLDESLLEAWLYGAKMLDSIDSLGWKLGFLKTEVSRLFEKSN